MIESVANRPSRRFGGLSQTFLDAYTFDFTRDKLVRQGNTMFESVAIEPPDAIFGLNEEFKRDSNPEKVNLTVGMYKDAAGKTPIMSAVGKAIERIANAGESRVYLPIDGSAKFNQEIPLLVCGAGHAAVTESRVRSSQTPGGTGALRVAGEMLHRKLDVKNIWISNPTWANHRNIFSSAGLHVQSYSYLDESGTGFDYDQCIASIEKIPAGDSILLHTVCHNPTGVDPTREQWQEILQRVETNQLIPIFDFAYQGFGESIEDDAFPIRKFSQNGNAALVCSSFSKNFNLYGERVGALTVVANSPRDAEAVHSQIKSVIRSIYSNPPTFGSSIVETVFADEDLKKEWKLELESIRTRINSMREIFAETIANCLGDRRFDHLLQQRGMFSYSGISPAAVEVLKDRYSIYLLKSGRINVAGINEDNVSRVCNCIAETTRDLAKV